MSTPSRPVYNGPRRKLVLAFDVGTTYSGISYSVLDPGQVPDIKGVTRFPAHDHVSGAAKIPTIIYYDRTGTVRAVGSEAMQDSVQEMAEEGNWLKAEWFKLHLRSIQGDVRHASDNIPPLPLNKTVVEVFADFLTYLLECASSFIQESDASGRSLWPSVQEDIGFVLSHPNGWEGAQQSAMRRAAVLAKLIPDTEVGHTRLCFVTEGEASLHFAIENGLPPSVAQNGEGVIVVDAGGGTIDITSYSKNMAIEQPKFEEIAISQCHFHGSAFVSIYARRFLEVLLENSAFAHDIDHIVACFDKTTKVRFRNPDDLQPIKFGLTRDNDEKYNIRFGQLKLPGSDVAQFFQPSLDCITRVVKEQRQMAHKPISHVVLLGGFSANDWLFDEINSRLSNLGLNVLRPTNHVNKAVSDGAIAFYLDSFVCTRVSKLTYGTVMNALFDAEDPEHQARFRQSFIWNDGTRRVKAFDIILPKNTQVKETREFRRTYWRIRKVQKTIPPVSESIYCYRGMLEHPRWMDTDPESFTKLCTIQADIPMRPRKTGPAGYLSATIDMVLQFGLTELKAYIAWEEEGMEKRTTPKVIYDVNPTDVRGS